VDIVIALDNTGSMHDAMGNIKEDLLNMISAAEQSSDFLQLGYLTFKDNVTIQSSFTRDMALIKSSIMSTTANGGAGPSEALDEAKMTAVNFPNFNTQTNAHKLLILITDALPGGTNDITDIEDITRMHIAAQIAASKGIKVYDIFVPTSPDLGQRGILEDDSTISGGLFVETDSIGRGTDMITSRIQNCTI
jgi:Mg-chelatase subunit ChlD